VYVVLPEGNIPMFGSKGGKQVQDGDKGVRNKLKTAESRKRMLPEKKIFNAFTFPSFYNCGKKINHRISQLKKKKKQVKLL